MAGEDLAKQKKIRGGHGGHAKKLMGEIQGILDNPPIEKRYELEQLKNALVEKLDVLKNLDNAVSKLMKDSAEVDESAFAQELSDASDHIMIYRRVVRLVDVELKKTIPIGAVTVSVTSDNWGQYTSEVGSSNVDTALVEHTVVSQPPSFTPQLTSSSAASSVRVKLPKLEVKKFKGIGFEWQEFWDAFESAIHTNAGLSDVDKFSYL